MRTAPGRMPRLSIRSCCNLQFDDTSLAYLNDPEQREHVRQMGGDPDRQHVEYSRHINEALARKPDDMAVTTHTCRCNFQSSWAAEGGYDHVAAAAMGRGVKTRHRPRANQPRSVVHRINIGRRLRQHHLVGLDRRRFSAGTPATNISTITAAERLSA